MSTYYGLVVLSSAATQCLHPVVKFSRNGPERRSATCVWRSTT